MVMYHNEYETMENKNWTKDENELQLTRLNNGIISNSVFLLAYTLTIKEVKTVPTMSTNNNPRTLPINLYTVGPPKVQPLDLTKLGDVPLKHSPQKDSTRALIGWEECVHEST